MLLYLFRNIFIIYKANRTNSKATIALLQVHCYHCGYYRCDCWYCCHFTSHCIFPTLIYLRMCSHDVSIVAFQGWHICVYYCIPRWEGGVARSNAQGGSTPPTARISLQFPSPGIVRQPPTFVYVNCCILCWFQRRGGSTEDPRQV